VFLNSLLGVTNIKLAVRHLKPGKEKFIRWERLWRVQLTPPFLVRYRNLDVNEMKISSIVPNFTILAISVFICACSGVRDGGVIFVNGYGDSISLDEQGAVIDGHYYPSRDCSTESVRCFKYGALFAVVSPFSCGFIDRSSDLYEWDGVGVKSFLMAMNPHDPYDVVLSTTYGGWVAFNYVGRNGVVALYHDPGLQLGIKNVWYGRDYIDQKANVYRRVGAQKFMSCSRP